MADDKKPDTTKSPQDVLKPVHHDVTPLRFADTRMPGMHLRGQDPLEVLVRRQDEELRDTEHVLARASDIVHRAVADLEHVLVRMHAASAVLSQDGQWAPFDTTRMAEIVKQGREFAARIPSVPPRDGPPRKVGQGSGR